MVEKALISRINSGRCFLFVGSGPSCDVGYPSWEELAKKTYAELTKNGLISDKRSYEKYLQDKKFPDLFQLAERDIGSRRDLINLITKLMEPTDVKNGQIYQLLCKWPFACYLTTNYDNEINDNLISIGEYYSVIRNSKADCSVIRDGSSNIIQKLHSDLLRPNDVVLTLNDYHKLYVSSEKEYYRKSLHEVFRMFDFLIIGHSLADIDINYILQLTRENANASHPIYMLIADCTKAEEKEYFDNYNIILINYSSHDGSHSELIKILKSFDLFITPRKLDTTRIQYPNRSEAEVESATSIFLYRKLQGTENNEYLMPIILLELQSRPNHVMNITELVSMCILKNISPNDQLIEDSIKSTLSNLIQQNLIIENHEGYQITNSGIEKVQEISNVRKIEKDQAYGQFEIDLANNCTQLMKETIEEFKVMAENVIVTTFEKRGLAIANQVFSGQTANTHEKTDIFGCIASIAMKIDNVENRLGFMNSMHHFLIEPSTTQKKYLASISQGYFLYHLLGLDPKCSKIRSEIFNNTLWFCDSSVIIPYIAVGCHNYEYAKDLFQSLNKAKATLYTTHNLLIETQGHYDWAIDFVASNPVESIEFLKASLAKGSYKQNLFLDAYIRLSAEGVIGNFKDYINMIFPKGENSVTLEEKLQEAGITVIDFNEINGFNKEEMYGEIENSKAIIKKERERIGTYKSRLQVESEAEIWTLINGFRSGKYSMPKDEVKFEMFYFVSQSRILDNVFCPEHLCSWFPEAIYRYLSTLPGITTNPDLLQQCMLQEFYYSGISFIDKEKYNRFFGLSIDSAKISFEKEKANYIKETEENGKVVDDSFYNTPDLEKPFFINQMAWKYTEIIKIKEERAIKSAKNLEEKIKQLESEKDKAWKGKLKDIDEQEKARLRNLKDPKHLQKRKKQAKKRKNKK